MDKEEELDDVTLVDIFDGSINIFIFGKPANKLGLNPNGFNAEGGNPKLGVLVVVLDEVELSADECDAL